ncbi:Coatomer subunit delta [Taenia crassiceps]|uniref:Coatomer subunit delta n=1 Tax=Taenia crassiceps TaxID=6207 RepID=A0ABR4Q300_9CEST
MVLLAAAICTRDGRALVSRQFVEMSKSRIEGLISTFPKLADPEMDSHEEKMFNAVRENQMQEARELSKRKARELELARHAAAKQGLPLSSIYNTFSSVRGADAFSSEPSVEPPIDDHPKAPLLSRENWGSSPAEPSARRGMQLGSRGGHIKTEMDKLTDMIRSEVPSVISETVSVDAPSGAAVTMSNLHVRMEERLVVQANRDGGVDLFEVSGVLHVRAGDEQTSTARIRVDLSRATARSGRHTPTSFQTHPNIDKITFQKNNLLAIKPGGKSFIVGKEVAVLKWRLQSQAENALPLLINCWPAEIAGGFEVNVEYDLQDTSLSLQNFCITIPLPPTTGPLVVSACDGDYEVDARRSQLRWTRPLVDADNATGSLEFTVRSDRGVKADLFFPVCLDFTSPVSYCGVEVIEASDANNAPVKFSTEVNFHPDRYEIL